MERGDYCNHVIKRNDACFPLSRRGEDRLYHAVNAHVVKEKQTGREVSKGDWEAENKERNKCPDCTQPRRWRCVKVEVLSSDLIIYAAGCRGLPLRFTALRKQEQIERRWMVLANRREPNRASKTAHSKQLSSTIVTSYKYKISAKGEQLIGISWFFLKITIDLNYDWLTSRLVKRIKNVLFRITNVITLMTRYFLL